MKLATIVLGSLMLAFSAGSALATTHIIEFGGTHGFTYSPSTLQVNVGDTIVWQGDFSSHPLMSTSVPSGAATIPTTQTGTSFTYIVRNTGAYNYQCLFHNSVGMKGSFTAALAGVKVTNEQSTVSQNFPNPAIGMETMVHIMLDKPQHVKIEVFDSKGTLVATPMDGMQPEGMQMVSLDVLHLPSGSYSYVVTTEEKSVRKNMVILK